MIGVVTKIKYSVAIALAVLVTVVYAQHRYDRAANYEKVEAIVTKVEENCYLRKVEGTKIYTTDDGPCDVLDGLRTSLPDFEGTSLEHVYYVKFDYISPVDGDWYSARHKQARHQDGSWIREGDKLEILAHTAEPEKTSRM